jgi:hypothetical protein
MRATEDLEDEDRREVRGLLHGRTDRVADEAFAPWHLAALIVLHVAHDPVLALPRHRGQRPNPLPASRNPRTAVGNSARRLLAVMPGISAAATLLVTTQTQAKGAASRMFEVLAHVALLNPPAKEAALVSMVVGS